VPGALQSVQRESAKWRVGEASGSVARIGSRSGGLAPDNKEWAVVMVVYLVRYNVVI